MSIPESDQDNGIASNDEVMQKQRRQILMDRARMMGLRFSNNIATDKLQTLVNNKLEGITEEPEVNAEPKLNPLAGDTAETGAVSAKPISLRQKLHNEQMRLIRVRITCMDPKKKDLPGEIFTIANEYLGTVRKYIPFGEDTDAGYHVPYCLYRMLDARKFLHVKTMKDKRTGTTRVVTSWVKEFSLDILPPLTPQEIQDLKTAQLAAGM